MQGRIGEEFYYGKILRQPFRLRGMDETNGQIVSGSSTDR
jgi:hypothetical protein